jgi:hypothetical protein
LWWFSVSVRNVQLSLDCFGGSKTFRLRQIAQWLLKVEDVPAVTRSLTTSSWGHLAGPRTGDMDSGFIVCPSFAVRLSFLPGGTVSPSYAQRIWLVPDLHLQHFQSKAEGVEHHWGEAVVVLESNHGMQDWHFC